MHAHLPMGASAACACCPHTCVQHVVRTRVYTGCLSEITLPSRCDIRQATHRVTVCCQCSAAIMRLMTCTFAMYVLPGFPQPCVESCTASQAAKRGGFCHEGRHNPKLSVSPVDAKACGCRLCAQIVLMLVYELGGLTVG
jgi:hypothetical protein